MGKKLEYLIGFFVSFITPVVPFLLWMGILLMIDTITGVWAARKRGEKVTSRKAAKGIYPKLIIYPMIVVTAQAAQLLFPMIPFLKMGIGMVAVVEWLSIMENANDILGFSLWIKFKDFLVKNKEELNEIKKTIDEETKG